MSLFLPYKFQNLTVVRTVFILSEYVGQLQKSALQSYSNLKNHIQIIALNLLELIKIYLILNAFM